MVFGCHVISQDHMTKGSIALLVGAQGNPLSYQVWWPRPLYVFGMSRDIQGPRDHRVMRLYQWEPLQGLVDIGLVILDICFYCLIPHPLV